MTSAPFVPVYLNQRYVFDLLSMLQGGISTVASVTQTKDGERATASTGRASFGLSDVVSTLLKIDLSVQGESKQQQKDSFTTQEERVYTPASLFYQLRKLLEDGKQLLDLKQTDLPTPGSMIRFRATLARNPLVQAFDAIASVADLVEEVTQIPTSAAVAAKTKKPEAVSKMQIVRKQVGAINKYLRAGETIDITGKPLGLDLEVVLTLELPFLSDPTLADLVDGEFEVVAKVIRSFVDPEIGISFLRKTPLAAVPSQVMFELETVLSGLTQLHGFKLPAFRTEVKGPAIHVLPIAIYA